MEAEEIAVRRTELSDQLARLQAPVIAADEAYRRADGLIKEIDRQLRERQADELMQVWPMPINPANWGPGMVALKDTAVRLWGETNSQWERASAREDFKGNLPLILLWSAIGLALVWRGRWLMERVAAVLRGHATPRWHRLWALFVSLGQVVLPTVGFTLIAKAIRLTSMLGPIGLQLVDVLPAVGFAIFASIWLGGRVFPEGGPGRNAAEPVAGEARRGAVPCGSFRLADRARRDPRDRGARDRGRERRELGPELSDARAGRADPGADRPAAARAWQERGGAGRTGGIPRPADRALSGRRRS